MDKYGYCRLIYTRRPPGLILESSAGQTSYQQGATIAEGLDNSGADGWEVVTHHADQWREIYTLKRKLP